MEAVCVDLCCGLGGWAEGFLAEGFVCVGYDVERLDFGEGGYPGVLVLQDILELDGRECQGATVIVASPPCTEPSYRAMPWKRAKALNAIGPPHRFIELFNACFRIQREASEAAGHYIPMIVENVKGAQRWVGRARWHYGSYYLWGDVPALMPFSGGPKVRGQNWSRFLKSGEVSAHWRMEGLKVGDKNSFRVGEGPSGHFTEGGVGQNPVNGNGRYLAVRDGFKQEGSGREWFDRGLCRVASNSSSRKRASAEIAKIPFPLARWIARCFKPEEEIF